MLDTLYLRFEGESLLDSSPLVIDLDVLARGNMLHLSWDVFVGSLVCQTLQHGLGLLVTVLHQMLLGMGLKAGGRHDGLGRSDRLVPGEHLGQVDIGVAILQSTIHRGRRSIRTVQVGHTVQWSDLEDVLVRVVPNLSRTELIDV